MDHRFITANGIRLHYVEEGVGPLIILLHGFPDFWYSWRKQTAALASAGFRVVAPDLRGYNLSDRPAGVSSYENYYRANFRHALVGEGTQVRVPTLVLWGRRDPFLSPRLAEGLEEWVDDPEVVFLPEAGHWLYLSHAPEVNDRLLAFVRRIRI